MSQLIDNLQFQVDMQYVFSWSLCMHASKYKHSKKSKFPLLTEIIIFKLFVIS